MDNAKYRTQDILHRCKRKLGIEFRGGKELNGWFYLNGEKKARVTVPKGRKHVPRGTYAQMARQLHLTVPEFDALLACPLSRPEYEKLLAGRS